MMRNLISEMFNRVLDTMENWLIDGPWYKRWVATPFYFCYFGTLAGVVGFAFGLDYLIKRFK